MGFEQDAKRQVLNHFGPRSTDAGFGGTQNSDTIVKSVMYDFTYDDLPGTDDGKNNDNRLNFILPAGSIVVSAKLYITTGFTSTSTITDLTVGLKRASDGTTAIAADGLITAVNATQTTIATAGNVITGTGALVGFVGDATYDAIIVVAPSTDDLTAGAAKLVVEYITNS